MACLDLYSVKEYLCLYQRIILFSYRINRSSILTVLFFTLKDKFSKSHTANQRHCLKHTTGWPSDFILRPLPFIAPTRIMFSSYFGWTSLPSLRSIHFVQKNHYHKFNAQRNHLYPFSKPCGIILLLLLYYYTIILLIHVPIRKTGAHSTKNSRWKVLDFHLQIVRPWVVSWALGEMCLRSGRPFLWFAVFLGICSLHRRFCGRACHTRAMSWSRVRSQRWLMWCTRGFDLTWVGTMAPEVSTASLSCFWLEHGVCQSLVSGTWCEWLLSEERRKTQQIALRRPDTESGWGRFLANVHELRLCPVHFEAQFASFFVVNK